MSATKPKEAFWSQVTERIAVAPHPLCRSRQPTDLIQIKTPLPAMEEVVFFR